MVLGCLATWLGYENRSRGRVSIPTSDPPPKIAVFKQSRGCHTQFEANGIIPYLTRTLPVLYEIDRYSIGVHLINPYLHAFTKRRKNNPRPSRKKVKRFRTEGTQLIVYVQEVSPMLVILNF